MENKNIKRLPCGKSDFGAIMTENYAYIDKTRFIELLENEANSNQFFIRPRKFGKSLLYSMLYHYYDINKADDFEGTPKNCFFGVRLQFLNPHLQLVNSGLKILPALKNQVFRSSLEKLFGNLYIGKHPAPKHNSYLVLQFDSLIFTGKDRYEITEYNM
jgi:hypothetical protein